jgi:serine/threonine protein kinase
MSELTPVRYTAWHRGSRYFRLRLAAGERCFVKTDGRARLLEREVAAAERLEGNPRAGDCTPRLRFHELGGSYPFAAFGWIDHVPLAVALGRADFKRVAPGLADGLLSIVDALGSAEIIHRDVTPQNLLVGVDARHGLTDRLTLIDFAFAVIDGVASADARVPAGDLDVLGSGFSPGPLVWDDAYSSQRVLELMGRAAGEQFIHIARQLRDRVGARMYRHPAIARVQPIGRSASG